MYVHKQYYRATTNQPKSLPLTTTAKIYRPIKFIPKSTYSITQQYSGCPKLEQYIETTKLHIDKLLPLLTAPTPPNLTGTEQKTIKTLMKSKSTLTIKPADKNLGIVIMDTNDYITQCMTLLKDTNTYRKRKEYPLKEISRLITNTLISFQPTLYNYNKQLYNYLLPNNKKYQIPKFYGIPKIHKTFQHLPPFRPIISHCNSPLTPTARLLDHTLQPLAQSYPDYLHNSTSLSLILQDIQLPDKAILVSIDVDSLYPSIPQTECMNVIYDEMYNNRHLIPFNPNLIIQLLHTNINYNYFEFGIFTFQQTNGTAMGVAFSPTIANIYMSVTLRNFLQTQPHKPQLLKRYIDDITMIWNNTEEELLQFLTALNTFHPSLHFTYTYSYNSIDFLDLTIYKGPNFSPTPSTQKRTKKNRTSINTYIIRQTIHTRHTKQLLQENVQDIYELTLQKTTTTTWLNCLNNDY